MRKLPMGFVGSVGRGMVVLAVSVSVAGWSAYASAQVLAGDETPGGTAAPAGGAEVDPALAAQSGVAAPQAPSTPVAAPSPASTSRITFVNQQPGVGMYLVTPKLKVYLCQKECTLELRQASYQVGLGAPGRDVLAVVEPIAVGEGPQVVETTYVSRADDRRAGLLVLGIGAALSVASLVTGIYMTAMADSPTEETVGLASLTGGAAGLAISSVIGLILAARHDEAQAIIRPADR